MTLEEKFHALVKEEIDGMSYEEAYYFLENDAHPQSGSIAGLVYYSSTERIAQDYLSELLCVINEYSEKIGQCVTIENSNQLVWTAWEIMICGNAEQVLEDIGFKKDEDEEDEKDED